MLYEQITRALDEALLKRAIERAVETAYAENGFGSPCCNVHSVQMLDDAHGEYTIAPAKWERECVSGILSDVNAKVYAATGIAVKGHCF